MELGSRRVLGLSPGCSPKLATVEVLFRQFPLVFMVCLRETACVSQPASLSVVINKDCF